MPMFFGEHVASHLRTLSIALRWVRVVQGEILVTDCREKILLASVRSWDIREIFFEF
jgi:hypothetical protein